MMFGFTKLVRRALGRVDDERPRTPRDPLRYDGRTERAVCPRCGPCLADRFRGTWVCGKCDEPIPNGTRFDRFEGE